MIHKNIKFGNVKNVTVVEFGKGSLSLVVSTNGKGRQSIQIKTIDPLPVGTELDLVDTSDQFKPEVVLCFNNKESFDLFMYYCDLIKKQFDEPIPETREAREKEA